MRNMDFLLGKENTKLIPCKMKWKLNISKSSEKFIEANRINIKDITVLAEKIIGYLQGEDLNIDIKKLKGNWKGFYRARKGKMRIILRFDFEKLVVFIEEIDYRKDAYK